MTPEDARLHVELEERLQLMTLVADLSAKFIAIPASKIDCEINDSLQKVCDFLGLDVGVLWQWELGMPATFVVTHFYRPLGGPPVPERLDAAVYFPWALRQAQQGKMFAVPSIERTPADAEVDRQFWRHFGVKSLINFPLAVGGGSSFGVLTFCMMRAERTWPAPLVRQLEFIAQVFANALVRKRDEQALQESELRLSLAADSAGVGLWSLDLASSQFWLTPKVREFFKFTADEVVTWERFLEVIHPEDRELVERVLQEVVRTEREGKVEFRVPQPDGSVRWLLSRGRLRKDVPSALRRVMGVAMDITERKRSEETVRQSSHALDQSPVAVVITDLQGIIVYVNRKFCEVSGYSYAESVGQNPRILKSGEFSSAMYQELWTTIRSGKIWRGEFHNRMKNGELFWESAVISPLFDEAGRITHFVGVKEDITERKKVEATLRKTELERTEQRSQLAHLSRVNMLGELAGSLAHELNQPLTAILSNAQAAVRFLAHDPVDLTEVREILTDIVAEDKRAGEVIRRLRLLLKQGEVQFQPLNVNEVVQEVLKLVRSDLVNHNFTAQTELAPGLPELHGDRVQLQQVLLNLVMNGCDAMTGEAPSHRQLTIRTELEGNDQVQISVSDCGTGIAPEKLEQVFEAFYTTKSHGLGLGLAVCRTIITAHGGKIWATNNAGRGAAFHFTLPVAKNENT